MKKKLLNLLWVLLLLGSQTYAQNRTVTGIVTGKDDGLPLPGVSVMVKGTARWTQTSTNGRFTISVPAANSTLVFSFVGYQTFEANANSNLNISLITSTKSLTEAVVVGYGTIQRKDVTGSIGSVKGADLTNQPVASFD